MAGDGNAANLDLRESILNRFDLAPLTVQLKGWVADNCHSRAHGDVVITNRLGQGFVERCFAGQVEAFDNRLDFVHVKITTAPAS